MRIIILFGAPGVGKGTQGALIAEKYGYLHMSTGSILREEVARHTPLGEEIDSYISKGYLVPDKMICNIVVEEIDKLKNEKGIILDGFPRTLPQAEFLDIMLFEKGLKVDLMIDIRANRETLIDRLVKRGTLSHRMDDTLETIEKRLRIYKNQTLPLVGYYQQTGRYNKITSENSIENTFDHIVELIDPIVED